MSESERKMNDNMNENEQPVASPGEAKINKPQWCVARRANVRVQPWRQARIGACLEVVILTAHASPSEQAQESTRKDRSFGLRATTVFLGRPLSDRVLVGLTT